MPRPSPRSDRSSASTTRNAVVTISASRLRAPRSRSDGPVRNALTRIGELWHHDVSGVFVEHRATQTCLEALVQLRGMLPAVGPAAPVALRCAPAGDPYLIPSRMARLVLASAGYREHDLGADTPMAALRTAIARHRPAVVWLALSTAVADRSSTERNVRAVARSAAAADGVLVVGGRGASALRALTTSACTSAPRWRSSRRTLRADACAPPGEGCGGAARLGTLRRSSSAELHQHYERDIFPAAHVTMPPRLDRVDRECSRSTLVVRRSALRTARHSRWKTMAEEQPSMCRLRLRISMSLDGCVAGPEQSRENPLGIGGESLHDWVVPLAAWRGVHGLPGGEVNASTAVMEESLENIGATIMGRNMFGGGPGPWDAEKAWKGWWGDDPPFHHPVYVLTHHARAPLMLEGGTTFTFVTDGIESALEQAGAAAGGRDIALAGGAEVCSQYLAAGLVDEMLLHVVPILLGGGARLFERAGPDLHGLRLERVVPAPGVVHVQLTR